EFSMIADKVSILIIFYRYRMKKHHVVLDQIVLRGIRNKSILRQPDARFDRAFAVLPDGKSGALLLRLVEHLQHGAVVGDVGDGDDLSFGVSGLFGFFRNGIHAMAEFVPGGLTSRQSSGAPLLLRRRSRRRSSGSRNSGTLVSADTPQATGSCH